MKLASKILIALVAIEHIWFLVLEMFLWTTPLGLATFKMSPEIAASSATLAQNQGLYNGFLAAGLVWSLFRRDAFHLQVFFSSCVVVAGCFGAATASTSILFVQALPAALALGLVLLAGRVSATPRTRSASDASE
jgi:putative membrane protein